LVLHAGDDASEAAGLEGIVGGAKIQHHLIHEAQIQNLKTTARVKVSDVHLMHVAAPQKGSGFSSSSIVLGAPPAGEYGFVTQVLSKIVCEAQGRPSRMQIGFRGYEMWKSRRTNNAEGASG
jgi:hypothetical protein